MYKQNGYINVLETYTICRKTCSAIITMKKYLYFYVLFSICVSMVTPTLLSRGIFYITSQLIKTSSVLNQIL